jgi:hypothetical protein
MGPEGPVLALSDATSANERPNVQLPDEPPVMSPPPGELASQAVTISASAPTWVWVAGGVAALAIVGAGVAIAVRKKR